MSKDERVSQLQRDLATQYKSRYLSHTSALCEFVFLAAQSQLQVKCIYPILHQRCVSCASSQCVFCMLLSGLCTAGCQHHTLLQEFTSTAVAYIKYSVTLRACLRNQQYSCCCLKQARFKWRFSTVGRPTSPHPGHICNVSASAEDLRTFRYLCCRSGQQVVAPADVGAKAYANSAPQHSFSTQEVILSMLQHDSTFLQLLALKSHEAGIDDFILESAVAGIYRDLAEREESTWRFKRRRPVFICSSAAQASCLSGATQEERMPSITMVIPSDLKKVDQVALQSLYQYWGVPCVPDMYRK